MKSEDIAVIHTDKPVIQRQRDDTSDRQFSSAVLKGIPNAVICVKNRMVIFANPAVESVFGWCPEELIGEDLKLLYGSEEVTNNVVRHISSMLSIHKTYRQEHSCLHKDGKVIICSANLSWTDDDSQSRMIIVIYNDVTEQKNTERILAATQEEMAIIVQERTQELQKVNEGLAQEIRLHKQTEDMLSKSEQEKAVILDAMSEMVAYLSIDLKVIWANAAICTQVNLTPKDIEGKYCYEVLKDQSHPCSFCPVRIAVSTGNPQETYDFKAYDKRWVLRVYPIYDREKIIGAVKIMTDITERLKAEEALKASEERYRLFLNGTDDIAFLKDEKQRYIFVNQALIKFFAKDEKEIIGKTDFDLMTQDIADVCKQTDDLAVNSQAVVVSEEKIGSSIYESRKFKIKLTDGQSGIGCYIRDVTKQKQLEAQFMQAQKMEAIGTLAGGIAHDFNNLLMGIEGYTSLMLLQCNHDHPNFSKLKGIENQVQSGADLTQQLLGFARWGRYEVKATDVTALMKKTSLLFGRTRKEIFINEHYQEDLWIVDVDQGQIEQVLLNLYVNAWQAMPGGGEIYLKTENVLLDAIDAKTYHVQSGKFVKISVTDTGVGMDEKTRQRIFDPFFTTKEMGRGTGLGLAAVYGIIKGHSGFIDVFSECGHGSCFTIYLPASETKIISDNFPEEEHIETGMETILLVDDEEAIIDVTKEILETFGYQVITAMSGREAIEIYKKEQSRIDMVILDMVMPGMGGGETFDILKTMNKDIKVILSSGYSVSGQATEIMQRGVKAFIQKPYKMEQFSQKIRDTLIN